MKTARLDAERGAEGDRGAAPDQFDVPFEDGATVLDALIWIRAHRDPSLAMRYSCISANVCKECTVALDGTVVYACTTRLVDDRAMVLDPLPGKRQLRDLVTETRPPRAAPWVERPRAVRSIHRARLGARRVLVIIVCDKPRPGRGHAMAKTALSQLQDQIEAVRREAYAEGYACTAAMQAIRDFAAHPAGAPAGAPRRGRRPQGGSIRRAPPVVRRGRRAAAGFRQAAAARRATRGGSEVLQAMPAGTARPAEIRAALQRDKGVAMAFTSIRHSLEPARRAQRGRARRRRQTWRYLGGAAASR